MNDVVVVGGDGWGEDVDDGFTFDELVPPSKSKRLALQAINEDEERNRRPPPIPQLASSSVIIKKSRQQQQQQQHGGQEDFEIKTVLCRTPRSQSTIAGFAPKSTCGRPQPLAVTDSVAPGHNDEPDDDQTDVAIDDKIKEELKDLEAHFFGSSSVKSSLGASSTSGPYARLYGLVLSSLLSILLAVVALLMAITHQRRERASSRSSNSDRP
jgi:hypothetical protein